MKKGRTLQEIAKEVEWIEQRKRDFIADTRSLKLVPEGPKDAALLIDNGPPDGDLWYGITDWAHRQIADRLKIPARYYDRMLEEAPDLLAENVNRWFKQDPEPRMIRTLENGGKTVRAFLSNRYRRLDNYDLLMKAALPVLEEYPDLEIASCELTQNKLYIKAVTPRIQAEIKKGDIVRAGVVISNSEIGTGKYRIDPLVERLVCENGMIAADPTGKHYSLQRYHLGRSLGAGEEAAAELLTDETQAAKDHAFWLESRDVIKGALDRALFNQIVDTMRASTERPITGDPVAAVRELANKFRLNESEAGGITKELFKNEEPTQFGLLNAVTRYSQQVEDYDRATDLERIGGEIITLEPGEWRTIAEAAA